MSINKRRIHLAMAIVLPLAILGFPARAALVPEAPGGRATWQDVVASLRTAPDFGTGARDAFINRSVAQAVAQSLVMLEARGEKIQTLAGETCVVRDGVAYLMAPDTPIEYVEYVKRVDDMGLPPTGGTEYDGSSVWFSTAKDGVINGKRPITLTFSFVPDGTGIAHNGRISTETNAGSNLYAVMNFQYFTANPDAWKYRFRQAFNAWGSYIGVRYEEVGDDGSTMGLNGGVGALGSRGDIRIGGHYIDGPGGVLAYCYYPGTGGHGGDMVFDCDNNLFSPGDYWASIDNDYQRIRYVVGHEHGHGLGLGHVQPLDHSKLMEPIVNDNFTTPQDDDVRGGQSKYGDTREANDSAATATSLGNLSGPANIANLSISSGADTDWFRINLSGPSRLSVTANPVGATYPLAPYDENNPTYGPSINTAQQMKLSVGIIAADGNTIIAEAEPDMMGTPVTLNSIPLSGQGGTVYVRVRPASTPSVQRYSLSVFQFSTALYVDRNYNGTQAGTPAQPYKTVAAAVNAANATIDTIFVRGGNYNETFPNGIGKALTVLEWDTGNVVQIGAP